jgi:hypothetical protein
MAGNFDIDVAKVETPDEAGKDTLVRTLVPDFQ